MSIRTLYFLIAIFLFSQPLSAQSSQGSNLFSISLLVIGLLLVFGILLSLTDNLMQIEAKKNNLDTAKGKFSIFPGFKNIFGPKRRAYFKDNVFHKLSRGFDIKLDGEAKKVFLNAESKTFAIQPPNFNGISPIPKVVVNIGDEVKVGDHLFFDKKRPDIFYVSPVSGEVIEINRGEKRSIASIVILADKEMKYREVKVPDIENSSRDELIQFMKDSGTFVHINQRPFDIVPDETIVPKNIFISTFSTAPLAPDFAFIAEGKLEEMQLAIDLLNKLTDGDVYLGLDGRKKEADIFNELNNCIKHFFAGKHPAGNVGVQIHHTAPIGTKDSVWTLEVQDLISIGSLIKNGKYSGERIIALTGAQLNEPGYVKTYIGAKIEDLIKDGVSEGKNRFVSGDPLSGKQIFKDGYLNFSDSQLTVIEEGDNYELFGWLLPISPRPSHSNTFPNFLYPNHKFIADTNTHGEKRAFVVTGQYEDVLPMNIYPQHLMKAILAGDIEKMEGLGINELTEEDIAICEFVCTSKQPLQSILRDGLEMMREQG